MVAQVNVAITGANGILATALRPYFPTATYLSRESLDVANGGDCRRLLANFDLLIHCGAQTSAKADPAALCQVNIVGTANVLAAARKAGARFVFVSSDGVYPGTGNHRETDGLQPNNTYAWSKLGGECVAQSYHSSLIVRGSWYETLHLAVASTDGYTSKIPVAKAAAYIAALSQSTVTGVVNIGGPRRSLFEIVVTSSNPGCRPIKRKDAQVGYPIQADLSLNCERLHSIVGF